MFLMYHSFMIILIGASASGKTEVAKLLVRKYGFKKFVTTTTRKIRCNEVNGIDYFFISKEEFLKKKNNNQFIETTLYNNNYYGTEKNYINDKTVLIVEPDGFKVFMNMNDPKIVSFFLDSKKEKRKERMILRKDDMNDILNRIEKDDLRFNNEIKKESSYVLDSDIHTIEELTDIVYKLYKTKLEKVI